MEFWSYYRVLRRKRWLILATALAAIAVAIGTNHPTGGDFSATATLAVPSAERFFFIAGLPTGPEVGGLDSRTVLALSLIQSWEVAQRVVQRQDLLMRPDELQRRTSAEKDRVSNLIRVAVTGKTALEAMTLANAVAETAAAYDEELQRRQVSLAREFRAKQVEKVQGQLEAAEDALLAFRQRNGVALDTSKSSQAGILEGDLLRANLSLQEIDARLSSVLSRMNRQSSTRPDELITNNPVAQQLRTQLVQLEVALASDLAVHTENYPSVIALKAKIQAIKDRLNSELAKIVSSESVELSPIYDALAKDRINLETEKLALQARREALQGAIAEAKRGLPSFTQRQLEQSRLTRTVEILNNEYSRLQGELSQARVKEQEAQNLGSLSVVDKASTAIPSRFSGLRFKLTLASVLGLLGGIGLTFFLEYLDNTLKSPENAERVLGMPVLAAVPRHNPPFDEAYRLLGVHLAARESVEGSNAIVVTSPKPQAGTSTVVANLARALAQAGRRTIVVDAALLRPTQHLHFGVVNEKGLAEILKGETPLQGAITQTDVPNLRVLPSGAAPKEIGGLLSSQAMEGLLSDLMQSGDIILIDTPPAGVFADVLALAQRTSGVLLVLDARHAPRGAEEQVRVQLDRLGAKVIGVVLTHVRPDLVDSYVYHERFYKTPSRKRPLAGALIGALVLVLLGGLFVLAKTSQHADHTGRLPFMLARAWAQLISFVSQI